MYSMFDIVIISINKNKNIQGGCRPYVLIQNDIGNKHSNTTIVIPITKHLKRKEQPTHYVLDPNKYNNLKMKSMILAEQITTINCDSIMKKIGFIENKKDRENIIKCYMANVSS